MKKTATRAFWTTLTAALGILSWRWILLFADLLSTSSRDLIPHLLYGIPLLTAMLASGGVTALAWFFISPDSDGIYRIKRGTFPARFYAESKQKDFSFCKAFWLNIAYVLHVGILSTAVVLIAGFLYFTGALLGTILYCVLIVGVLLSINVFLRLDTSDVFIMTVSGLCIFTFSACSAGFGVLPVVKTILCIALFFGTIAALQLAVFVVFKVGVRIFRHLANEDLLRSLHGDVCPRVIIIDDPAEQKSPEVSQSQEG